MTTLIAYMIKSILASGILYAYYQLALRNKRLHVYNRCYLLATVVVSLVLPLVNFNLYAIEKPGSLALVVARPGSSPATTCILFCCMAAIAFVLLMIMLSKISWVYRIRRKEGSVKVGKVHFIQTRHPSAPFSFLNNLFWRDGMSTSDGQGDKIFIHEMTHIRQKHSCDKLFIQTIACICWVNPFYWLIQKELNVVHEFLADAACIEEGDTGSFALMLLQSHDNGRYLDPSHYFFRSPVVRRLNMVAASGNIHYKHARKLMVLPLIASLLLLFSFKESIAKDGTRILQQMEREQKLLDEKRTLENAHSTSTLSAHTYFIRYRYRTFI
ncbi:M56 family metallopeptidase [Flavitalea sp. BT771]|uniref:M56 family metallopeptidase n=1 Tax=Flavitalea sp. BT771 TaxID=3063329 RepID=UPI0026E3963C|nr:M56 family metallopeptidase [Flavitalea sp. BT771]MDO6432902.1 M56 family metallopeptidase [Flavitalea sp. BT771]MDV6221822.1 M56 family metallopeptidase [Flavitalea sp. BT771]